MILKNHRVVHGALRHPEIDGKGLLNVGCAVRTIHESDYLRLYLHMRHLEKIRIFISVIDPTSLSLNWEKYF